MPEVTEIQPLPDDIREKLASLNLNMCLTCGTCAGGCPGNRPDGHGPQEISAHDGPGDVRRGRLTMTGCGSAPMCKRCQEACPMDVDIPNLIFHARSQWPREKRPKGILGSCDYHVRSRGGAMGVPLEDFKFTVEDVGEELAEKPGFRGFQGLRRTMPGPNTPSTRTRASR